MRVLCGGYLDCGRFCGLVVLWLFRFGLMFVSWFVSGFDICLLLYCFLFCYYCCGCLFVACVI